MQSITPEETYTLLQSGDAFVIDVREQNEFDQCHIEGTVLVPLSQLPAKISEIKIPTDKKLIFHCRTHMRSIDAISYLKQNILKNRESFYLEGGILAWVENGLPVITGEA